MKLDIRKFQKEDIEEAIAIWNDIVIDGVAFPQMEPLDIKSGIDSVCISCIQIMLDDVVIFAMQAMR